MSQIELFAVKDQGVKQTFYCSTERMTFLVETVNARVTEVPPIARKFIGQSFADLQRWLSKQPGLIVHPI